MLGDSEFIRIVILKDCWDKESLRESRVTRVKTVLEWK